MNKLAISIPIGLGDLIHVKSQLDSVAFKYDVIELSLVFTKICAKTSLLTK